MNDAPTSPIPVLLVEDNAALAKVLREVLTQSDLGNYEVTLADCLAGAAELLGQREFDVVLLDLSLPDSRGLNTLDAARRAAPQTPIVVLTAEDDETLGREVVRRGAQDFLIKGQADDRLVARAIRYAVERREILRERERLIEQLQAALAQVKRLSGMLPICWHCKKVRDDKGYWNQIESYIREHSEAEFSHGLCPECAKELYPDVFDEDEPGEPHPPSP